MDVVEVPLATRTDPAAVAGGGGGATTMGFKKSYS